QKLVVVCRSGARSSKAVAALTDADRTAHNLSGGMMAWHEDGRPVVRDDGTPGSVI
ncbi:MAG: rhodanese-like domain-containing protein, partial [Rhodococcus sp.]|nr:rhodanese-like domain-containing protein [Rhodococcus sp. (in: high G+C Gram-positive bacteria)]